jgi:hypothetical protein
MASVRVGRRRLTAGLSVSVRGPTVLRHRRPRRLVSACSLRLLIFSELLKYGYNEWQDIACHQYYEYYSIYFEFRYVACYELMSGLLQNFGRSHITRHITRPHFLRRR